MDNAESAEDYSPIVGYRAAAGDVDGTRQIGVGTGAEFDQGVYQFPPVEGTQGKLPVWAELVASVDLCLKTRLENRCLRGIRNQASEHPTDITVARAGESNNASIAGHIWIVEPIWIG